MSLACGIDVGGTKIAGGVVDEHGVILEALRVESPATDAEAIEEAIAGLVTDLRSRHDIATVGVGAAGYIDKARAVVLFAPNVAWRNEDLKGELEKRVDLPVVIENDANAAAWGEFVYGAGHDVDDLLLVTVGTGVGGGLVLDGEVYRGANGVGAEIGHMRVVPNGILCGCGKHGCFEQYASGSALVREARALAMSGAMIAQGMLQRAGGDLNAITGPLITEAAQHGDQGAIQQLSELGRWLGEGIASLTEILDPGVVVIGGGVSEADELLLGPTREAFGAQLVGRGFRPIPEIRKARLGNRAGLIGAADLSRR
ncbi:ROK family glucokinase [Nocardioides sp. LMS-CY]|uniref:Glucokinase n=1 Tax=Nocardioides soli TaxID=1036020 RepID=A0A7W4VRF2_9ACTN|nr:MULTISPECIES: ROK family glucokinase [Nocardioides]MBB3040406.1 glucokinase [Nocardioides soli]QWF24112.1 ROK family glucokinase [Nocardioides sp. LMS-CY]